MTKKKECLIFCRNVCYLRKKYRLSQKSMALLLGIGVYSVCQLEKGILSNRIKLDTLVRLNKVFEIPLPDLFAVDLENNR